MTSNDHPHGLGRDAGADDLRCPPRVVPATAGAKDFDGTGHFDDATAAYVRKHGIGTRIERDTILGPQTD